MVKENGILTGCVLWLVLMTKRVSRLVTVEGLGTVADERDVHAPRVGVSDTHHTRFEAEDCVPFLLRRGQNFKVIQIKKTSYLTFLILLSLGSVFPVSLQNLPDDVVQAREVVVMSTAPFLFLDTTR